MDEQRDTGSDPCIGFVEPAGLRNKVIRLEDKLIEVTKMVHQYHSSMHVTHWQDCPVKICSQVKETLRAE